LPLVIEEELRFTAEFVRRSGKLNLIIPHLGLLGGNLPTWQVNFQEGVSLQVWQLVPGRSNSQSYLCAGQPFWLVSYSICSTNFESSLHRSLIL
jgi:hypothetical protein